MKILVNVLILIFILSLSNAHSCSKDYFGNCDETGSDSWYNSMTNKDYFGNAITRDNIGFTDRCSKDYFGNCSETGYIFFKIIIVKLFNYY